MGAIILAAGQGRRMGGVAKAFLPVCGRPLLAHSAAVFEACDAVDVICLVVGSESEARAWGLVRAAGWRKVGAVCPGGQERQDSVRCGLDELPDVAWVVVHDAARPLITESLILDGLSAAHTHGAAIAAVPVRDTVKVAGDGGLVRATLDRRVLWAAQTPQVFRASLLREAHAAASGRAATDDASLVEALGRPVRLYPGRADNLKVTVPGDVALAEYLLGRRI